jgi:hypothetical protein
MKSYGTVEARGHVFLNSALDDTVDSETASGVFRTNLIAILS